MRPSVRLHLTLVYGGLFLVAGAILLGLNYALVQRSLVTDRVTGDFGMLPETGMFEPAPGVVVPGHDAVDRPFPIDGSEVVAAIEEFEQDVRNQTLDRLVVQSAGAGGHRRGLDWSRMGGGRTHSAPTAGDHRHGPPALGGEPARTDRPRRPYDELKELADLARTTVDNSSTEREAAGIRFEVDLHPAPVRGDPVLLQRLVDNLVENGVRHNVPGGWLDLRTTTVDG